MSVLARGRTLETLRRDPLRVSDDGVERAVRLTMVADPAEAAPVALALVCTKGFDTREAARALSPALAPGAVVLSLQNGVDGPATIARECPGAAVGGVAVYLGCQRLAPDHVVRRPSRDPSTGRLRDLLAGGGPGAPGEALSRVGAAIGVPVRIEDPARRPVDQAGGQRRPEHGHGAGEGPRRRGVRGAAGRRSDAPPGRGGHRRRPRGRGGGRRPTPPGPTSPTPAAASPPRAARPPCSTSRRAAAWSGRRWWVPSCARASGWGLTCRSAGRATPCCASRTPGPRDRPRACG